MSRWRKRCETGLSRKAEIWIPYGEVLKHYKQKRENIHKRVRKSLQGQSQDRTEKMCLMNMCVIFDGKGSVLALDKVTGNYLGTTFPGGDNCDSRNRG